MDTLKVYLKIVVFTVLSSFFVSMAYAGAIVPNLPESQESEYIKAKKCMEELNRINNFPGIHNPQKGKKDLFIVDEVDKSGEKGFAVFYGNSLKFCPDIKKPIAQQRQLKVVHSDIENSAAAMERKPDGVEFVYNPHNEQGFEMANEGSDGNYDIKEKCQDALDPGSKFNEDVNKKLTEKYVELLDMFSNMAESETANRTDLVDKFDQVMSSSCKKLDAVRAHQQRLQQLADKVDRIRTNSIAGHDATGSGDGGGEAGQDK